MNKRIQIVMLTVLCLFSYLAVEIFALQIIQSAKLTSQAIAMRSRYVELSEYSRGDIVDRYHTPLTGTHIMPTLYFIPSVIDENANNFYINSTEKNEFKEQAYQEVANFLAELFCNDEKNNKESKLLLLKEMQAAAARGNTAIKLRSQLTPQEEKAIKEKGLPGLIIAPTAIRYRDNMPASHIIGYLNNENGGTGVSGIEKSYDEILRIHNGEPRLAVTFDARGNIIPGLMGKITARPNHTGEIILTLDKRIQQLVEKVMDESINKGAIVIMDVTSREIIAMASRPTFNHYDIEAAGNDQKGKPLMNRALTAYYPGSMFKIVDSIAALEEGIITSDSKLECNGKYTFPNGREMSCWYENGHGKQTFTEAFANSCNPSFIQVSLQIGKKKLMEYGQNLHLCSDEIIGYTGNKSNSTINIEAGEMALANACLGQQGVMLSPLQICSLIATVADDGQYAPPVLVLSSRDSAGQISNVTRPQKQRVFSRRTALTVKNMMEKCVAEGTGKNAAIKECSIAGKTATAQTGRYINDQEILNVWFGGFFPAHQPRWAMVILIEEGKSGARDCAPLFAKIAQETLKFNPKD